jgi:hypothetical protein
MPNQMTTSSQLGEAGSMFKSAESGPVQCPTADDDQNTEDQKTYVPRKRPIKVVRTWWTPSGLLALHDVEDAPAGEDEPEVEVEFGARRPAAKP